MIRCPYCKQELVYEDYFGWEVNDKTHIIRLATHARLENGYVEGDIYKCGNKNCEMYQKSFHTHRRNPNNLHEGYPC